MSFLSTGTELARFRRGVLPKVALAVLLVIPLIYGALYLWAFWAPTDHMDKLPVGIVNLDEAAEGPDGERLTAGDDVVEQLLDGRDLDWRQLDADQAAADVADGEVYFSVTIPQDFSETLAGLQDDPRAGRIDVVYNDANSFLASTLGKQAMVQLRDAVAETTTQTAADKILVGVEKLSDGTRDAADAATTLDDGAAKLQGASARLSAGLGELAEGTSQLVSRAPELVDGTSQLATGLGSARDGGDRLAAGSAELAERSGAAVSGSARLADGLGQLSAGAQDLADGASAAATGGGQLAAGAERAAAGSSQLADGLEALNAGSARVAQGTGAIAQLAAANPGMTLAELDAALQQQGASLAQLAAGSSELSTGLGTAAQSSRELAQGVSEVSSGAAGLRDGTVEVRDGAATLASKTAEAAAKSQELAGGVSRLSGGAQQLASGSAELAQGVSAASAGADRLAAGAGDLASGATRLDDGAQRADDGSAQLAQGAAELHDGSSEFATKLAEGADEAPSFERGQTAKIAETMAAPVQLDETTENPVQGFGGGFAPFFIALATFVGALITWLILHALPKRPLATNASGLRTVLTGFWPAAIIGVGQTVIMMLVLVYGIGLQPEHWVGMTLFMLLTTFAFLALQQMFIVLLGTAAGRVVSLVLLMLQLSSSGGTYPVETTPRFFQILHPFMPASYVVDGLRQLVGGGIDARFWTALAVMGGILVVSLAVSAAGARRQKVWTLSRLHPELAI
ncbi:YhgE/Pip domain-containing protein [Leucobacter sp. CSA1]|uniref:YhgE/Pip domain-containing protein n=1 Tax=Leucobacter chromiisoli TaxID=2796471 RepID=A0A934Q300_9MICO|nr:YhgE/Pip domain-containing protein [Leucobacter chromiisoli]MBK0417585.1 YhgE/Pip domain-containing protein [Leucobacter chromiisoli]